jgi:hypothetical protein
MTRIGPLDVQNKKIRTARAAPMASTVSLSFFSSGGVRGEMRIFALQN